LLKVALNIIEQTSNRLKIKISGDLKWESHINNICAGKANKTLGFQRCSLNIGSTSVKEQAYKSSGHH
jgi:hypothetical protein